MSHTVFISHRLADQDIAEAIRYHLSLWGVPKNDIFLSSDARNDLTTPRGLTTSLKQALWDTKLFVLVYTFADQDWSYCMWEAGVATHPSHDAPNIVVFQYSPDRPKIFSSENIVSLSEQSIRTFVSAFFRNTNFFPGEPPYRPDIADEDVNHFARRLHRDLKERAVAPKREFSRWQYFQDMIQAHSIFGGPATKDSPYDLFMVMPFAEELKPVFDDHVKKIALDLGLQAGRADDFFSTGSIIQEVWAGICHAKIIVADCTGRNPNVFYEIGMAHTLDKTTVLISQSMNDIPFDLRHLRVIEYQFTPRGMERFEQALRKTIDSIFERRMS